MRRTLRSSFATLALLTAMLGAPPAQTRSEREALAQALRRDLHPTYVVFHADRQLGEIGPFEMLLIGRGGEPIVLSLLRQ